MALIGHLENFSVLKTVLLLQNYATIWIYTDQSYDHIHGDVISEYFMEETELQPKSFFDLNNLQSSELSNFNFNLQKENFQDKLHVFLINQSLEAHVLDHVTTEENIVVISDNNIIDPTLSLKKAGYFGRKILFITNSVVCLLKSSQNHYLHESLPINSNETLLVNLIQNAFSTESSLSYYNMNQSVLTTFFQMKSPHSGLSFFRNKFVFNGPDGYVTEQIGKLLNAKIVTNTDYGFEYPEYANFFTSDYTPNIHFLNFHKEIITTNVIYRFNQRSSDYADLYMSAKTLIHLNHGSKDSIEFLYPHKTDCLRIVVPRINIEQSFLIKLFKNKNCRMICLLFIIMVVFKVIFGRIVVQKWSYDIFITLSIFLGQSKTTRSSRSWESIWNALLVLLPLFSTAVLSAICYKTIVTVKYQAQINSLQDLIESNLTIYVPTFMAADIEAWGSNLDARLADKIVFKEKIWLIDGDSASVWQEGSAKVHLIMSVEKNTMRIMKEPLYCGLVSYSVSFMSPIKQIVNTVVHRMIENGLWDKQLEWYLWFMHAMNLYTKYEIREMSTNESVSLNLSQMFGVFILYGCGICISCIVALMEILWRKIERQIGKLRNSLN